MKKMFLLIAAVALFSGCGHISGGVAPSNIPLAPDSYRELGPVVGIDCVYHLLGIFPLSGSNETKDALADALMQIPGTRALINITADTFSHNYILVTRFCTQVQGTAVAMK